MEILPLVWVLLLFLCFAKEKVTKKKCDPEHFADVSLVSNFCGQFVNSLASQAQTVQIALEIDETAQRKMTGDFCSSK
ncbi:hypothetical protein B0187_05215 [Haemophilus paracuniculus]|uniref:Uncharacterized protein n=1 Tax=Haemophilus paracuniculus TaxID=734 RepID=A0A1T0ASI7_9PAST|nr:hypothetical protein B0187_05215 [Haemophilus paracuniculus]